MLISSFTTCKTQDNLVTVDYFYYLFVLPVDIVTDTSAMAENECIRQQYAPHMIPDVVISDNSNWYQFKSLFYTPLFAIKN